VSRSIEQSGELFSAEIWLMLLQDDIFFNKQGTKGGLCKSFRGNCLPAPSVRWDLESPTLCTVVAPNPNTRDGGRRRRGGALVHQRPYFRRSAGRAEKVAIGRAGLSFFDIMRQYSDRSMPIGRCGGGVGPIDIF
jgi:hypothetical protein